MKRTRCKQPSATDQRAAVLDPARLNAACGGLDIAVRIEGPQAPWVPSQHNERLITR
jgi:hypothetical protein